MPVFLRHVYPSVLPFIQEISAEDLLSTLFWNDLCLALGEGTVSENGCCCSVTTSCQTLCDSMDCSMPGFPVLHYLLEFTQIHVYWVNDAIQPSHPLSPPSPFAFTLFQHQSLLQWMSSSHQVAKVLKFHFSTSVLPVNISDLFPLGLTGLISMQPKGLSRVFSNTTVQKHQFFSTQPSSQSNSHIHTWPLEKP